MTATLMEWFHDRKPLWKQFAFLIILCFTLAHVLYSGVYRPAFVFTGVEKFGQMREEMAPLQEYLLTGEPITLQNPRQYGPVFLFVSMPFLLFVQDNALEFSMLLVGYLAVFAAFILTYRLLKPKPPYQHTMLALLLVLWFNFGALYYMLGVKGVETWELALMVISLTMICAKRKFLAGTAIAAATLIKLLPGIFFLYLLIKERKAFWYGIGSLVGMLLLAQGFFGAAMGVQYLPLVITSGAGSQSWATSHFENNAIKGMVYKIFSGFTPMEGYPYIFILEEPAMRAAYVCSTVLQLGVLAMVIAMLWKRREVRTRDSLLKEFGFVSAAMLLISPSAALEYATLSLLAFSIGLYLLLRRANIGEVTLFGTSYLLLGQFVPFHVFRSALPLPAIREALGLGAYTLDEVYKAVGFPFIGFVLLFVFFSMRMREDPMGKRRKKGDSPTF